MAAGATTCPYCGSIHPIGTKFCPTTGKEISRKCLRCWSRNVMDAIYCQECGVDLSTGTFGIPHRIAEEWGAAFAKYEWSRTLVENERAILTKLIPRLDLANETIVCGDGIGKDGWMVSVNVNGYTISNSRGKAGTVNLTNWRLLVVDYERGRATGLPYQYLQRAVLSNEYNGSHPTFALDFGSKGSANLIRKAMPEVETKVRGTLSRMLAPPHHNAMMDILYLREVDAVNERYGRQNAENKLYINWFNYVIESRQKF